MSKVYSFLCIAFLSATSLNLKANNSTTDSLMLNVNKADKIEKLELLEEYIKREPTNVNLIDELQKEAIKQSSYLNLASAYKAKVYYYTRIGNIDSIRVYLNLTDKALNLFDDIQGNKISKEEKKKYDNIFKMLYTTKTALYLHEGKYDLALMEINFVLQNTKVDKTDDFENQLYTLSGMAYLHTKKYNEALTNFRKAYELVNQTSNESNLGKYSYYMALEGVGSAYAGLNKYKEAVLVADSLINKIEEEHEEYIAKNTSNVESNFIYGYFKHKALTYAAQWNIKENELHKARVQLDDVETFIKEQLNTTPPHTDFDIYYIVEAEYYIKEHKYNVSEKYLTSLINRLSIQEQFPIYYTANELLATVLEAQGKHKDAYKLAIDLNRVNDSINTINFSSQLAEMNILYEVDKSKLLAEQRKSDLKNTQIVLSVIAFALFLSLLVLYLIYRNRKTLIEKNKQLYSQYKSIEDRNKKIKELQQHAQEKLIKDDKVEQDNYQILIDKLDRFLEDSKAYLDQDVNREKIALEIGTNRQYLIEAIKEKRGKTFNEYIYSYRLKYAYNLIINNREKTISEVLNESGFSTRATFYKTFKEAYGLTPRELRDILK